MRVEFGTEWVGRNGTPIKVVKGIDGSIGFIKNDDGYNVYYMTKRSFLNSFTPKPTKENP